VTIANVLLCVGFAIAVLIYRMQRAASRRRDVQATRALLAGVKSGMAEGWGSWFFSNGYSSENAGLRARQDFEKISNSKNYGQVFLVPAHTVAALLTSPSVGDLVSLETITTANLALYRIGVFNQLVKQQTEFNTRHAAEIVDDTLPPERRTAIAREAYGISNMIHADGIGEANLPGGWYRSLTEAVEKNVCALDIELARCWLSRICYDRDISPSVSEPGVDAPL